MEAACNIRSKIASPVLLHVFALRVVFGCGSRFVDWGGSRIDRCRLQLYHAWPRLFTFSVGGATYRLQRHKPYTPTSPASSLLLSSISSPPTSQLPLLLLCSLQFHSISQLLLTAIVLFASAIITAVAAANLLERHTAIQLLGLVAAPPDQRRTWAVVAASPQAAFDSVGAAADVALGAICGVLGAFMRCHRSRVPCASLPRHALAGFAVCLGVLTATSCAEFQGRGTGDAWQV
jgi:hypothetical protein